MHLERKLKWGLRLMALAGIKPFHKMTMAEVRAQEAAPRNFVTDLILGKPLPLAEVKDDRIDGRLPIRVYKPTLRPPAPLLVYFHGGGWVVGNLESHDAICRRLARDSGRIVVAVDYRRAPEYPFPTAVSDAFDALCWVGKNGRAFGGDVGDIAVAGDSAGGNLAAVVCQLARDHGGPTLTRQALIYPATDGSRTYPSETAYADAPILTRADMHWFMNHYLRDEADQRDPRFSPLLGDLHDLPPALILTAEYDPLLDQGKAYADALTAAGNRVAYRCYPRQPHGFLSFAAMSGQAEAAFADIGRFLGEQRGA